ncbi:MAG TPA: EamA family transporter [Ktedonobacteraceae bacterium]|jgi:drug/metabolite transporter (DMT)-like permease
MPLAALGLVLIAAVMHAGWNLLVKQTKQQQVFAGWALLIGSLCFLPLLFLYPALPIGIWPYILASACMEAAYLLALTWAYRLDDFSLVYPIARGSAPAFLFVWSALFLHEPVRPGGLSGVALLVGGLILIGSGPFLSRREKTTVSAKGIGVALLTALCISIYSAIDGAAVRLVPSLPYTILVFLLTSVLVAPMIVWRYGMSSVGSEWKSGWLKIVPVGICMTLTYVLVLQAYAIGRVSYAGAIREVSVVIAALVGWRWLGEGFGRIRMLGSLLIFLGILVIALFG